MDAKTCTKCGETKLVTEFHKHKKSKDGLNSACKACNIAKAVEWANANREKRRAYLAAYRVANIDKLKAHGAAYNKAHPKTARIKRRQRNAVVRENATPDSLKVCVICGVEKPRREFYAHNRTVDGYKGECKACTKEHTFRYWKEHPEKVAENAEKWRAANPEKVVLTRKKAWAKWSRANLPLLNAKNAKRRATKTQATPAWADHAIIDATYTMAAAMTKLTGVEHHVDHIVPLRSKIVSGLHVDFNLQILPAVKNMSKGNRHWPDMPQQGVQHGHNATA